MVVVVMPAFAQGQEGEKQAVSTIISRFVAFLSEAVCEGIDGASGME